MALGNGRVRVVACVAVAVVLSMVATGCQTARAGGRCRSGVAEDGTFVLVCKKGRWVRFISKADGQRLIDAIRARQAAEAAAAAAPVAPAAVPPPPATIAPHNFYPPGSPTAFEVVVADPSTTLVAAVRHELAVVSDWFAAQGGRRLNFVRSGIDIAVTTVSIPTPVGPDADAEARASLGPSVPTAGHQAIVFAHLGSGAVSGSTHDGVSVVNLDIPGATPRPDATFPYSGTFVEAREIAHAFGAPMVSDDPHDLLYSGSLAVDTSLVLDAAHDSYLGTGRTDIIDIANCPLWG